MYLAADIGGTKTHVAIYEDAKENGFRLIRDKKYPSKDYKNLTLILKEFLSEGHEEIHKMCLGIAGPIKNGTCKTTNLPWIIDAKELAKDLQIEKVALINDLESNAYGIKTLSEKEFYVLNKGVPDKEENQALVSAGTGLGEAGIVFNGKDHIPFACEGGHCDFAPKNALEIELLQYLIQKYGPHISYERILCGRGIYDLYCFLTDTKKEIACESVNQKIKEEDPPKVVSEAGVTGECQACVRALELFCSIYGAEAGNCALKFKALGGIFIGGGIAPKILPILKDSLFMKTFINKGRFKELLKDIPILIVLNENTALLGSAYYCHYYM